MEPQEIKKIEETAKEFFEKMTVSVMRIQAKPSQSGLEVFIGKDFLESESIDLDADLQDPQILIGERGQTLFEIQRILRQILIKKTGKVFYLNLDINGYKKKKIDYLRDMARNLANEAIFTREKKEFAPMSAYERRIIHMEIGQRPDIIVESEGQGENRHIVIRPR